MSENKEAATLSPEEQRLRGVAEAPKPEVMPEEPVLDAPKVEAEPENETETPSETGGEAEGQPDDKPKPNSLKYWKQRAREEKRAREAAEREVLLAQLRSEPKAAEPQVTEAPKGKPKLDDFASFDEYQEALTEWKVDQRLAARQKEQTEAQQKTAQQRYEAELQQRFRDSADEAREKYDDFDEVVGNPSLKVTKAVAHLVGETDNPGEVSYFLAKNPGEVKRLNGLSPAKAAVELGKLEARLASKSAVTKAPPPPAKAGGKSSVPKPNNAYSGDEWYAKRMAEIRRKA